MTLEKLYEEIGGDYHSIMERLGKEERVKKYVLLFLRDGSYDAFLQAVEQRDIQNAFRAIHTLKGVCMNLSFESLCKISSEVTEYLRVEDIGRAIAVLPDLDACYQKHLTQIRHYADSQDNGKGAKNAGRIKNSH